MSWHIHAFRIRIRIFCDIKSSRKKNCARLRKIALGLRKIAPELRFSFSPKHACSCLNHACMHEAHPDPDVRSGSWSICKINSFRIHAWWSFRILILIIQDPCYMHAMHGMLKINPYVHVWIHDDPDPDPDPCESCTCMQLVFFQPMIYPSYDPRATSALYSLIKFTSATTASRNSTANLFIHSFQESGIQVPELVQRYKKTLYKSASGHGSPNSIFWKTSRSLCPWMDVALLLQTAIKI